MRIFCIWNSFSEPHDSRLAKSSSRANAKWWLKFNELTKAHRWHRSHPRLVKVMKLRERYCKTLVAWWMMPNQRKIWPMHRQALRPVQVVAKQIGRKTKPIVATTTAAAAAAAAAELSKNPHHLYTHCRAKCSRHHWIDISAVSWTHVFINCLPKKKSFYRRYVADSDASTRSQTVVDVFVLFCRF